MANLGLQGPRGCRESVRGLPHGAGTTHPQHWIARHGACYNGRVLVGMTAAIIVGLAVGIVTLADGRLRIADEAPLTLLVCLSGAIAGWAIVQTLGLAGDGQVGIADVVVPLACTLLIVSEAWKGRRRTFSELGLHPHSE